MRLLQATWVVASLSGLALTAFGVGCGGSRGPQNVGGKAQNADGACVRDLDCTPEEYCDAGTCKPRTTVEGQCRVAADCAAGKYCHPISHRCVACINDDHCAPPNVCRADGTCGAAVGCANDSQCNGLKCDPSNGRCVQCLSSADCPRGQTCREKQCFSGGEDVLCARQQDCDPYGRICDTTQGKCVPCQNNEQCGAGRVCSAGICTTEGGGGGIGQACQSRAECEPYACDIILTGMCMPCLMDFMCMDLNDLMSGVTKICDTETGECVDPECQIAADCPAGEGCYDSHCGPCGSNEECRPGEICDLQSGVCKVDEPPRCASNAECQNGQVCLNQVCANCTSTTQCDGGLECIDGRCNRVGGMGEACESQAQCRDGFICVRGQTSTFCTRTCIGSGKGGDADCPLGNACYQFGSGALDGLRLCMPGAELASNTDGQPFDLAPGSSCADHNGCQTSVCYTNTHNCARSCSADRDCNTGEGCWAALGQDAMILGPQICYKLDNRKPAGQPCSYSSDCESGLCVGECSGHPCNNNTSQECGWIGSCWGTCANHCRTNSDCGPNLNCAPWPTMIEDGWSGAYMSRYVPACQPKQGHGSTADGQPCSVHADCQSDWCVYGVCNLPCAIKDDCTGPLAGRQCDPFVFTDGDLPLYAMGFCK